MCIIDYLENELEFSIKYAKVSVPKAYQFISCNEIFFCKELIVGDVEQRQISC